MKKYFLVGFLFLQVGFLYAQNENLGLKQNKTQKPVFKKWKFGLETLPILFSNELYVEYYLSEKFSLGASLGHIGNLPFIEGEIRYYPKMENAKNRQHYFSAQVTVYTSLKKYKQENEHPLEIVFINNMLLYWNRWQVSEKWYFSLGVGVMLLYTPLGVSWERCRFFCLPELLPFPAFSYRFELDVIKIFK